jgi:transposase-like protein
MNQHKIALSPTKDTQATLTVLKLALNFTKHKPDIIVSDHAQHFQNTIHQLFGNSILYLKVSLYQKSVFFKINSKDFSLT